jgi:hypothetical protein
VSKPRRSSIAMVILFLCLGVILTSSTLPAGTNALPSTVENAIVGGGDCTDLFNGFAVGMGVAGLLGCVWCPAGAVVAKVLELFAC